MDAKVIFLSLGAFLVFAYYYLPYFILERIPHARRMDVKYLLIWGDPSLAPLDYLGTGSSAFVKNKCQYVNCFVTSNRKFFANVFEFDAILFNGRQIDQYLKGDLPKYRSAKQKYVYANMESSHNYPVCSSHFNYFFNWTWTYKLDSDARCGYITVYNLANVEIGPKIDMQWPKLHRFKGPVDNETIKLTNSKTKAAAWFVSNCYSLSKREEIAQKIADELYKYGHSLHVYGGCGQFICPRSNEEACFKKIAKDYYFYFAFENSMAADYVTEKVLTAMNNFAIPVVFGAANYSRFLPPGSYLDGYKMRPQRLARRMADIIRSHRSNESSLYYDFFRWRQHYSFRFTADTANVCKLCKLMNDPELVSRRSAYEDFPAWWNSEYVNCDPKTTNLRWSHALHGYRFVCAVESKEGRRESILYHCVKPQKQEMRVAVLFPALRNGAEITMLTRHIDLTE